MASEGRCDCGCRIFFNMPTVITTASGSIRDIPAIMVLECVSCSSVYTVPTESGKKTLVPFRHGLESEKTIFAAALKSWKNIDHPEANESHIVLEDADKKDFERLGIGWNSRQ